MARKKTLYLLIGSSSLLLMVFAIWWPSQRFFSPGRNQLSEKGNANPPISSDASLIKDIYPSVASNSRKTIQNSFDILNATSSLACDELSEQNDKDACRHSFGIKEAVNKSDVKYCKSLIGEADQVDCNSQVAMGLAIAKRDKSFCIKIANQQDRENCLKIIADILRKK